MGACRSKRIACALGLDARPSVANTRAPMHCLISVVLRNWTAIYDEAQTYKRRILEASHAEGVARPPIFNATSGFLLLVDWDASRVLASLELPKPTGFLVEHGKVRVALWDQDEIVSLSGPEVALRLRHPWFNHVHTLDRTSRGLLVSSSGTDLLAEIDEQGELLWEFFLFDHGYGGNRFRLGQTFDRSRSYNRRYLPASLTTHPNSALMYDEDTVLATLFSTGELVRIHRRTAEVNVVLGGLRRPHSIRRRAGGGYMLCDTEGGRVVLLDHALQQEGQIDVNAAWIQDAVLNEDRLLIVGNRRIVMSALKTHSTPDESDNQVIELRDGTVRKKLNLGPENRIYMVEPVTKEDAETLAHGWRGTAIDMPWLRWETP